MASEALKERIVLEGRMRITQRNGTVSAYLNDTLLTTLLGGVWQNLDLTGARGIQGFWMRGQEGVLTWLEAVLRDLGRVRITIEPLEELTDGKQ